MSTSVRFDCFEVDPTAGRLFKRGSRIHLREQSLQVLLTLIERPGQVVTREDLRLRLWPADVFIDYENSLNAAVGRLREALGDSAERPRFVETLPRRGYRFIGTLVGTPPVDGAARRLTNSPEAYNEYAQGISRLDRLLVFRGGVETIRGHLLKALACDPGFGPAHEALALMYWYLGYVGMMAPREAVAAGIPHAVRAVEIDNTRAEARALVAQYYKQLDYNWRDVERELTHALELNPESTLTRMLHAVSWLMPQGRVGDAIAELERALTVEPLSFQLHFWLAVMMVLARDRDRGLDQARLLVDLEPNVALSHWALGVMLRWHGRLEQSIDAHRRAVRLSGGTGMMLGWLGLVLGSSGRANDAQGVIARLDALARTGYVPPSCFAWVRLSLGDVDDAFEWLDRAVDARDQFMMPIKSYAFFDPLRADPRFAALLRKMHLDP